MSTEGLTSPNLSGAKDGDEKYSALLIAVSFMGVIIALLLVRLVFNLFIDLCILCDSGLAARNCAEFLRKVCPWWHRRTTPENDAPIDEAENAIDEERALEENGILLDFEIYNETLDRYLRELLPCEVYVPNPNTESDSSVRADDCSIAPSPDVESELRTDIDESHSSSLPHSSCHEGCGGDGAPCSICLHSLVRGQSVYRVAQCGHIFHPHCLQQWLIPKRDVALGNNHCPNCRAPVVKTADLERILTWMGRQEALRQAGLSMAARQELARQRNRRLHELIE